MSDPVSNAEIEDVLSSIRRLVAGDRDETPHREDASEDTPPAPRPAEPDALVLTPSLRVEEASEGADDGVAEHEARSWDEDARLEVDETSEEADLEEVSSEVEAPSDISTPFHGDTDLSETEAVFSQTKDELAELDDAASPEFVEAELELPSFVRPHLDDVDDVAEEEALSDLDEIAADDDVVPEDLALEELDEEGAVVDEMAALEATPFEEDAHAIPPRNAPRAGFMFGSIRDDVLETEDKSLSLDEDLGKVSLEAEQEPLVTQEAFEPIVEVDEETVPSSDSLDEREDEVVDEAAYSELVEEPSEAEPLSAPVDDIRPADEILAEAVAAATSDSEVAEAVDAPDEPKNLFSETGLMPDEADLRELVAELLQQELQGPLGERITRNVRKLVRREIHRALAARDFD